MPTYTVHGLTLDSELEFPELLPATGQTNFAITVGSVPDHLDGAAVTPFYEVTAQQFLLHIPNLARFYVENGEHIRIQPYPTTDADTIRLLTLQSPLGVLLHQRHILTLHASAITTQAGAVLIGGVSAVGKSVLAAHYLNMGYRLLADDMVTIRFNPNGEAMVYPAYPRIALWQHRLSWLGYQGRPSYRLRPNLSKYSFPMNDQFQAEPVPLAQIVILFTNQEDEFFSEALTGINKLMQMLRQVYQYPLAHLMRLDPLYISQMMRLSKRYAPVRVGRPAWEKEMNEFMNLLKDVVPTEVS